MKISKFEDIIAWQKSQDLAVDLYREFSVINDFDFRRQILRAVISISNNIAEGYERSSAADFKRFLHISIASNTEVRSMLYLAVRLDFIDKNKFDLYFEKSTEISRLLKGFIKSIN